MQDIQVVTTDVAIVGGGAAGCYAALELQRNGVRPLIICKGLVGKSGASIFAGNLVLSGRLLGNTEENARDTAEFLIKYHNQFLIDQHWARQFGAWAASDYYPELEEAGIYFRRDDDGQVVTSPGRIRSIAANVQGNSGVVFMDLRRKQVMRAGIPWLEETAATALLHKPDGSIGGVFCLDIVRGGYVVVLARAVVLATGYSDRLHKRSSGTREMSADGLALAWRAGASMMNLEMQWWHTSDVAEPPAWQRVQIYPIPILGSPRSARMVNGAGEEFFNQQRDDPLAFGPYTVQLKALKRQVDAGKARYDGGYYSGFDHCEPGEVEAYTTYAKPFKQLGLDPGRDLIENAVTAHYRQGGVLVHPDSMRSSVPGLYVAGGLAGHHNGLIALATYDGKVAAEGVRRDLSSLPPCTCPLAEVEAERARLEALCRPADGFDNAVRPSHVQELLRTTMWNKVGIEKDATGLEAALQALAEIRCTLLPRMRVSNTTRRANPEWLDAIDAINMVDGCELIARSSLERQESRGPFMRRDFPDTDNETWLAANILHRTEGGGTRMERRPYTQPFLQPGFTRRPNMEVPW